MVSLLTNTASFLKEIMILMDGSVKSAGGDILLST